MTDKPKDEQTRRITDFGIKVSQVTKVSLCIIVLTTTTTTTTVVIVVVGVKISVK